MSQAKDSEAGVHFEYKVDLANPTAESLDGIKNELVRKIAENVKAEHENLARSGGKDRDGSQDLMRNHDRHYSIHSKD